METKKLPQPAVLDRFHFCRLLKCDQSRSAIKKKQVFCSFYQQTLHVRRQPWWQISSPLMRREHHKTN